jgi:hypothetical protein
MIQPEPPLRVLLHNVAMLPADGIRGNGTLEPADHHGGNHALHQAAEHASHSDVHFHHAKNLAFVLFLDLEGDVGHAYHLAAAGVDDLLIQQVASDAEHIFVGMVRRRRSSLR